MIDIESGLFETVATAIRAAYPNAYVTGEYVRKPPKFPAVSVVEMSNTVLRRTQDSGHMEHDAELMYQVDIYSNKNMGKKAECKGIAALIDAQFASLGFTRTFLNPVQNMDDATIYRMTGRYRAVASNDSVIFRG